MSGLRVYIAGASAERSRVRDAMTLAAERGLRVTFDWLAEIERVGTANPPDLDQAQVSAFADLRAIDEADVVWLLAPREGVVTTGAWAELGYALGRRVPVVVSGIEPHMRCLFASLAAYGGTSDEQAVRVVRLVALQHARSR